MTQPLEQSHEEGHGEGRGKVILLGEHSVVYGRPALAAGLAHGATGRARLTRGDSYLEVTPWHVRVLADRPETTHEREQLRQAFAALLEERALPGPVGIHAQLSLPASAGLGSSAALGVAVVRALDALDGVTRDAQAVAQACMPWERVFHGNPSGIDSAVAAAGGLVLYRRETGIEPQAIGCGFRLVIGYSGTPGSTKQTVAHVAAQHAADPARIDARFDAIAGLVDEARRQIASGNIEALGPLLDANHAHLVALDLSTPELDAMCEAARTAGAWGAKLTGGGGGGCMIALTGATRGDATAAGRTDSKVETAVAQGLSDLGYECFITDIGPVEPA